MNKLQALGLALGLAAPAGCTTYEKAPIIKKSPMHELEERALDPFLVEEEADIAMADAQEPINGCTKTIKLVRYYVNEVSWRLSPQEILLMNADICPLAIQKELREQEILLMNADICPLAIQKKLKENVSAVSRGFTIAGCGQPHDFSNSAK